MSSSCVRLDPPRVEFREVRVGEVYEATVTVTNVGSNSRQIAVQKPPSKPFKFKFNPTTSSAVAPGMSVCGSVTFSPERAVAVTDSLEFLIDGLTTVELQLRAYPPACKLTMDSLVDFGSVASTSQVVIKQLPLTNQGSAPGQYQVQYNGDPLVKLSPGRGTVMPGATQWLTVELSTHMPGHIEETALVKLQSGPNRCLRIRAEVVDQALQIYDLQGVPLSCLSFGPVYFGTSRVERVVLRNNGPGACRWLCVLQDTAEGTELATELRKSTDAALLGRRETPNSETPHGHDPSQVVCCVPKQGRLGPYEHITLSVRFSPFCKRPVEARTRPGSAGPQDYAVFLLFEPVDTKHGFTPLNVPGAGPGVELAVTGVGLPVRLRPKPGASFHFLGCVQGQRSDLLCLLQNLCPQLPARFRFRKGAHFKAEPASGVVAPGQCQTTLLQFWEKTAHTMSGIHQDFQGHVSYQFTTLKALRDPLEQLTEKEDQEESDAGRKENKRTPQDIDDDLVSLDDIMTPDSTSDYGPAHHCRDRLSQGSGSPLLESFDCALCDLGETLAAAGRHDDLVPSAGDLAPNRPYERADTGSQNRGHLPPAFPAPARARADDPAAPWEFGDFRSSDPPQAAGGDLMGGGQSLPGSSLAPGQQGEEEEEEARQRGDMAFLKDLLSPGPGGGADEFSREWQDAFGSFDAPNLSHAPNMSTGGSSAPGAATGAAPFLSGQTQSSQSQGFLPSQLLDHSLGSTGWSTPPMFHAPPLQPPPFSGPEQTPPPAPSSAPSGGSKDMSAWFNLFADLDPLSNPDAIGRSEDELLKA